MAETESSTTPLLKRDIAGVQAIEDDFKDQTIGHTKGEKALEDAKTRCINWPGNKHWLLFYWMKDKMQFSVDIMVGLSFFYLDVILDLQMFQTFYLHGDIMFLTFNLMGIVGGLSFTLYQMSQSIEGLDASEKLSYSWSVLLGVSVPFSLHVALLSFWSLWKGKKHSFLRATKLAETLFEATTSAGIQTYALIFRSLTTRETYVGMASIGLSYASIAYELTSFDMKENTVFGMPGTLSWAFDMSAVKLGTVFIARLFEVASRITSIGLFQTAVRERYIFTNTGAVVVLLFDGIVMLALHSHYHCGRVGGLREKVVHFLPATFFNLNPLLERRNTQAIPHALYYSVRAMELFLMCAVAFACADHSPLLETHHISWPGVHDRVAGLQARFEGHMMFVFVGTVSSIGWMILVPIVRLFFADHTLLTCDAEMLGQGPFSKELVMLRDQLLDLNGLDDDASSTNHYGIQKVTVIKFHKKSRDALKAVNSALRLAVQKSASAGPKKPTKGVHEHHCSDLEEDAATPLHFLKHWAEHNRDVQQGKADVAAGVVQCFQVAVNTGKNLQPVLTAQYDNCGERSCAATAAHKANQARFYVEFLKTLTDALECAPDELTKMLSEERAVFVNLVDLVPSWEHWSEDDAEVEFAIFSAKCMLLPRCMAIGKAAYGPTFEELAVKLVEKMSPLPASKVKKYLLESHPLFPAVMKHQLFVLVELLSVGDLFLEIYEAASDEKPAARFTNEQRETLVEALIDCAKAVWKSNKATHRATLTDDALFEFKKVVEKQKNKREKDLVFSVSPLLQNVFINSKEPDGKVIAMTMMPTDKDQYRLVSAGRLPATSSADAQVPSITQLHTLEEHIRTPLKQDEVLVLEFRPVHSFEVTTMDDLQVVGWYCRETLIVKAMKDKRVAELSTTSDSGSLVDQFERLRQEVLDQYKHQLVSTCNLEVLKATLEKEHSIDQISRYIHAFLDKAKDVFSGDLVQVGKEAESLKTKVKATFKTVNDLKEKSKSEDQKKMNAAQKKAQALETRLKKAENDLAELGKTKEGLTASLATAQTALDSSVKDKQSLEGQLSVKAAEVERLKQSQAQALSLQSKAEEKVKQLEAKVATSSVAPPPVGEP